MNVELQGTLKVIFDEVQISDNLSKKEVVITIDENTTYPQDISIQAINSKIDLLKNFKMGEKVIVKCNLKGKASNGKYFNHLNIWDITHNPKGNG